MLDQILNGLKSQVGDKLTQIPGFNVNQIDDVIGITGDVVKEKVTSEISGGGIGTLMNLFSNSSNNSSANSLQNSITEGIVSKLISKLGLNSSVASSVAGVIVPMIISKITGENSKTPDDDPSPLANLFGDGDSSSIGGMLNKLF